MNEEVAAETQTEHEINCRVLAERDAALAKVIENFGLPPFWNRPNSFATLVLVILEQQVSLASAKASFERLCNATTSCQPERVAALSDAEFRDCAVSRQKASYIRELAIRVCEGNFDFVQLEEMSDSDARTRLIELRGVGAWTADVYLLMALRRADIMPRGDIALHEALVLIGISKERPSADEFLAYAERWRPYRSAAARILWHCYLSTSRQKTRRPSDALGVT